MSTGIGGASGHHYTSADVLAWLEEHTGQIGARIQESMNSAEDRIAQMKGLNEVKSKISQLNISGGGYGACAGDIDKFLKENENASNYAELQKLLGPLSEALKNAEQKWNTPGADQALVAQTVDSVAKPVVTNIQTEVDAMGKEDQMNNIRLQNDVSAQNQAMQLASNMMAGFNSSAMATIGNIRA